MISYTSVLSLLLDVAELGNAVFSVSPGTYLTSQEAFNQSLAAVDASTSDIPAELLLGMAWVESRYYPTAVSRIEHGIRRTGIPAWRTPPKGTRSFFCGVTQATAENSWQKCKELQNPSTSYHTTVIELKRWLATDVCHGNLRCALTGYSGGFPAIKRGNRYAAFVLQRTRNIHIALKKGYYERPRVSISFHFSRNPRSTRN